jgi:hypothetical protein
MGDLTDNCLWLGCRHVTARVADVPIYIARADAHHKGATKALMVGSNTPHSTPLQDRASLREGARCKAAFHKFYL